MPEVLVTSMWVTYSYAVMVVAMAYTMIYVLNPTANPIAMNLTPVTCRKMKIFKRSSTLIQIFLLSLVLICVRSQVHQVSLESVL